MKTPENTHENAVLSASEDSTSTAQSAPSPKPARKPRKTSTRPVLPRQWELRREKGFKTRIPE